MNDANKVSRGSNCGSRSKIRMQKIGKIMNSPYFQNLNHTKKFKRIKRDLIIGRDKTPACSLYKSQYL